MFFRIWFTGPAQPAVYLIWYRKPLSKTSDCKTFEVSFIVFGLFSLNFILKILNIEFDEFKKGHQFSKMYSFGDRLIIFFFTCRHFWVSRVGRCNFNPLKPKSPPKITPSSYAKHMNGRPGAGSRWPTQKKTTTIKRPQLKLPFWPLVGLFWPTMDIRSAYWLPTPLKDNRMPPVHLKH